MMCSGEPLMRRFAIQLKGSIAAIQSSHLRAAV
jgi:hypothetical protein